MSARLEDRIAIVTGGGQGIGEATARRFAAEGAAIVIADLNAETGERVAADLRGAGHRALSVPTDVADADAMRGMVARTVAEFGPPDILINNAGINVFADPLELTDEQWRKCFSVDLDGAWNGCRAVLHHMLELGRRSIVNVASVHSFQIIPHCFPYPVAKHGLIGLTRALAIEYAARGVRVNAVCPSYIRTQICVDYFATFPDPELEERRVADMHPVRRLGSPEEVAAAILFLASDECAFITGESLMVDGGGSVLFHDVP